MNVLGIISEYNPFHNGHLLHLNKSKSISGCKYVVTVMSGNFTQRGEPAIADKYARTEMALKNGASIVLELPVVYACASAEAFALGAVKILESCGIIDCCCFGSELGDIGALKGVAGILVREDPEYKKALKEELNKGISFPTARMRAFEKLYGIAGEILSEPNNILALEYLKALIKINSGIKALTITREAAHYHSGEINEISSAGAIRRVVISEGIDSVKKAIPESSYNILKREIENSTLVTSYDSLSHILQYILKTTEKELLRDIANISEGLENRIINAAGKEYHISEILKQIKTKRYTLTGLQRALTCIVLGITKKELEIFREPRYIRVLGFRKDSEHLLRALDKNASLPVITNIKHAGRVLDPIGMKMLEREIISSDIYYIASANKNTLTNKQEYFKKLIII